MFDKYKELCKVIKLDYKKDLAINLTIILVLLGGSVFLIISNLLTYGIILLFAIIFYVFTHFVSLNETKKQVVSSKEIAFNGFYRYLINLLKNGNILYSALKLAIDYSDEVLVDDINELISDIEEDTSLEPFLKFQSNFNDENIKQMIILLFKTQEAGSVNEVLDSINECMVNMQDTSIENYLKKEQSKIEKYYIVPIILSAVVIVILSIYIFSLLGDGIYV